ncbi:hypothetical protein [Melioribacter sp. OK-6-Me]|uniref:hypothetical protein n=1 Tax=unclassified Melioribacter TaxID=2627329 RepID=UPI003ED9EF3D
MEEKLKILSEQLKKCNPILKDFQDYYNELNQKYDEFQKLLEYASELKKDEKEFGKLYRRVAGRNASELVDKLNRKGYAFKKELGDAFENMGYRLLEQTRAGKKEDVYYGILRIFVAHKINFPGELIEAFKPIYTDEMFKVFIFSFLSSIIGEEKQLDIN